MKLHHNTPTAKMSDALCLKCLKSIKTNSYKVQCAKCIKFCHRDCANLTIEQVQEFNKEKEKGKQWVCIACIPTKDYTSDSVVPDPESHCNITLESILKENNYLKEIIRELRENNSLLKQNKQLLEEKVLGLEKKIELQKPYQNKLLDTDQTNKKRKLHLSTHELTTHQQMSPKSAPASTNHHQVENFNFQQMTHAVQQQNNSNSINTVRDVASSTSYAQIVGQNSSAPRISNTRPKRTVYIGTGETSEGDKFTGRDEKNKKVWLFVSRVPDNVDELIVKNYVKTKANIKNEEDLVVKHIPTKIEQQRPNSKCFQVGIKYEYMEMVYGLNFWPKRVAFERLDFKKIRFREEANSRDQAENAFLAAS